MTSPTYSPIRAPALKFRQANNPKPLASPQSRTSMPPPLHRWRRRLPHLAPRLQVLGVHSMNEALAGQVPVVRQPICFASSSDSLSSLSLVRWSLRLRRNAVIAALQSRRWRLGSRRLYLGAATARSWCRSYRHAIAATARRLDGVEGHAIAASIASSRRNRNKGRRTNTAAPRPAPRPSENTRRTRTRRDTI